MSLACAVFLAGAVLLAGPAVPRAQAPSECTLSGRASSSGTPLPGVSVIATREGQVAAATSTDLTGSYRLRIPAGELVISAELAAFARFERPLVVSVEACPSSLDVELVLASRARARSPAPAGALIEAPGSLRRPTRLGAAAGQASGQPRFSQLQVVQASGAGAADNASPVDEADPATRLLPPGFSTDAATSVVAVTGDAVNLDRGQLRDRLEALGRGEFAAAGAQPPEGFGGRFGGPSGPGGQGPPGGPGGFGGRGGIFPGRGRGNAIQGSANYTFGGSALDAAPYPLRANAQTDPDYTRQQFGAAIGGPLRIPGMYAGSRTTFFLNYSGSHSNNLVDQYATVPSESMRAGDFSNLSAGPIDPATGLPFAGGVIPHSRLDPSALALLRYVPVPNLPGTVQNYHRSTAALSASDGIDLRITHNFSGAPGRGGPFGRGGGLGRGGGGAGRGGGRGGRAGTAVVLNAQVQYRRNDADIVNVFPLLGGVNDGSSWSVPVSLNILHNRWVHNLQVIGTRTTSDTRNGFAGVFDVAGNAGITGVAINPFEWGVPNVSLSTFTSVRDAAPSERIDRRVQATYSVTRPVRAHTFRAGGDFRLDDSDGVSNGDARGTFVFTGLYSAPGQVVRSVRSGLRGLPPRISTTGECPVHRRRRPARAIVQPIRAGRLARSRRSDVEPRPALRSRAPIHRSTRADGEPGCGTRVHGR